MTNYKNEPIINENRLFIHADQTPNKYGYRLNINHRQVKEYYERYKKSIGIVGNFPISDEQRLEFEAYLIPKIKIIAPIAE